MKRYQSGGPSRADIDAMRGAVVVDFGTNWCGYCRHAEPLVAQALAPFPGVTHVRIEDGKGLPTGRSFGVRLWPTLVFLSDGREVARIVRPGDAETVGRALAELQATGTSDG